METRESNTSSVKDKPSLTQTIDQYNNLSEDDNQWIFNFIDIIYVVALFKIDQIFTYCGEGLRIYLLIANYFNIMFMTRLLFDTYVSIFKISGTQLMKLFFFCGISIFFMTLNISVNYDDSGKFSLGTCSINTDYMNGFASLFLFTRFFFILFYFIYYRFFYTRSITSTSAPSSIGITEIFIFKCGHIVASSFAMLFIFFGYSPLVVLTITSIIEMIGEFLSEFLSTWELTPNRKFLEERLRLLFMLVLGESVLGLLIMNFPTNKLDESYRVLFAVYVMIHSIGIQYFEKTKNIDEKHGSHPLDIKLFRYLYIWLNGFLCFFSLLASNGIVGLYYNIVGLEEVSDNQVFHLKLKSSIGLFFTWILLLCLHLSEKRYRIIVHNSFFYFFFQNNPPMVEEELEVPIETSTTSPLEQEPSEIEPPSMKASLFRSKIKNFSKETNINFLVLLIFILKIITPWIILATLFLNLSNKSFLIVTSMISSIPTFIEIVLKIFAEYRSLIS